MINYLWSLENFHWTLLYLQLQQNSAILFLFLIACHSPSFFTCIAQPTLKETLKRVCQLIEWTWNFVSSWTNFLVWTGLRVFKLQSYCFWHSKSFLWNGCWLPYRNSSCSGLQKISWWEHRLKCALGYLLISWACASVQLKCSNPNRSGRTSEVCAHILEFFR